MIGLKGRMNVSWKKLMSLQGADRDQVIDNSGAVIAECINVLKVKTRQLADGKATVGELRACTASRARRGFKICWKSDFVEYEMGGFGLKRTPRRDCG